MQLSLLSRLSPGAADSRRGPPSTVPGAWRDSAILQLESIAATNAESVRQRRLRRMMVWAMCAGVLSLWLALAWRAPRTEPLAPPPTLAGSMPAQASAPADPATAAVVASLAGPAIGGDDAAPATGAPAPAEARRKAAPTTKERARADEEIQQRLRLAQEQRRHEAERAQQLADAAARERAAAAEPVGRSALDTVNAQSAPRSVRELCTADGGLFGEGFCQQRECRKAEYRSDAVCVRLREIDLARQQLSAER